MQGDGIGPEIVNSSIDIINVIKKKLNLKIDLIHLEIGYASLKSQGTTFPFSVLEIRRKDRQSSRIREPSEQSSPDPKNQ